MLSTDAGAPYLAMWVVRLLLHSVFRVYNSKKYGAKKARLLTIDDVLRMQLHVIVTKTYTLSVGYISVSIKAKHVKLGMQLE